MGAQEYNRTAWPLLVHIACKSETVTYQDVANAVNRACGTKLTGHLAGKHALDLIETWCLGHGVPDLTAVVVSKEAGIPGEDFYRRNGLERNASKGVRHNRWSLIRNRVWAHSYDADAPPDL